MKVKTSEAIKMANAGKSLKGIVLEDINDVQVNVRDAMSLSREKVLLSPKPICTTTIMTLLMTKILIV